MEKRVLTVGAAIGLGLLLVLARLIQLTVLQSETLALEADKQHSQRVTLTTRRGTITDSKDRPLALSVPAEFLFVHPSKVPTDAKRQATEIASLLNMSPEAVNHRLHASAPFVWLKRPVSPKKAAQVRALNIPGIHSKEAERRSYPQGRLAASVLGFVDVDALGLEGVELGYDRYLRATPTEMEGERDAHGRVILAGEIKDAPEALNVRLTIDAYLQSVAERELTQAVRTTEAQAGTVIMLDPRTFAVLALAQAPGFDPNAPAASPAAMRRNRSITDCYEPGSTLKAMLAAAALDNNIVRPEDPVFCEFGRYRVGKHTIHDHHGYGSLTFAQVLQYSSNIGSAKIGERLGKDRYIAYLRAFGFGQKTGIDLPGEVGGILATPTEWRHINLVTASFGQGVAVTPLQLTCAYAALANDGVLMRPYIVSEISDARGRPVLTTTPQPLWQVVRPDTAHVLVRLLENVVKKGGTGYRAQIEGFRVAGKTGTSQKISPRGGYSSARIASFVGIVPADQPRLVMLVVIDEPKKGRYGGQVAAPVFQAIARDALAYLGVQKEKGPDDTGVHPKLQWASTTGAAVPAPASGQAYFLGMSLREARQMAHSMGWQTVTTGSGYVAHETVKLDAKTGMPVFALTLTPSGEFEP